MKKIVLSSAVSLLLLVLLTGCGGQELSNVSLVRTLGVDGAGAVIVTAVAGTEGERAVFSAAGADIIDAQEALETVGSERLAVTHVGQIVLGEGATARALWDEALHRDSGYGATVWRVEAGTAYSLLNRADDPAGRLKHLEESGAGAPSLLEAVSDLTARGRVGVPLIGVRDGSIEVVGRYEITAEEMFS